MNKKTFLICFTVLCMLLCSSCKSEKKEEIQNPTTENAESVETEYDTSATESTEGATTDENGNIIAPTYAEDIGNSNGDLIVKTKENNGTYDVLTYRFPKSTLESILYESHFPSADEAQAFFDRMGQTQVSGLEIDGTVVRYVSIDSEWIGFKKRDIINNLADTWEQLGYEVTSK